MNNVKLFTYFNYFITTLYRICIDKFLTFNTWFMSVLLIILTLTKGLTQKTSMKIIKNLVIIFCIFLSIIFVFGLTKPNDINLTKYNGEIEHLTFTTLMSFPDKALCPQNNLDIHYDNTKITPLEFERILNELLHNNYILIDIDTIYEINNEIVELKELYLPQNKKPIVLSFDNVTYKSSYKNSGSVDKIIIDRNNN